MPYIGYWQLIESVDKFILYGNVAFEKKSWVSRNRIINKKGDIVNIIIPLRHKSCNKLISEIIIDNSLNWNSKLLKTIRTEYGGALFFEETFSLIEPLLNTRYETLMQLNCTTISQIAKYLDINTVVDCDNSRFVDMEEVLQCDEVDYSQLRYLGDAEPDRKTARVIEMCKRENASRYVNAIGGKALYKKEEFLKNGIELFFIETRAIDYQQFAKSFTPNLSIIDVLMHNGKEGTKDLLKLYGLI